MSNHATPKGKLNILAGGQRSSLLTGLVAYWKLNDNGNDSTGVYNLTAASDPQAYTTGKIGNCSRGMSAAGKYLYNASFAALTTTSITMSAWIMRLSATATNNYIIRLGNNAAARLYMNIDSNEQLSFLFSDGTNYAYSSIAPAIVQDVWHFSVIWLDISDQKSYVQYDNGTPTVVAWTGTWTGGIGAPLASQRMEVSGAIVDTGAERYVDEVGIWNRVLTSAERTTLWNAGSGKTYPF